MGPAGKKYDLNVDFAGGDVGFTARGRSLEHLFTNAWDAVLESMVQEVQSVKPVHRSTLTLHSGSLEMLLFDFLQELIFRKDAENRFYRVHVDVKAVTLYHFNIRRIGRIWEATAVLDV